MHTTCPVVGLWDRRPLGLTIPISPPVPSVPPASGQRVPAIAPVEAGQLVGGRYQVEARLGSGGMGTVWLGHDEVLGRKVALKELTAERTDRRAAVLREARAGSLVAHPGVVQVYGVVLDDEGSDWIVMEALSGQPLSRTVHDRGSLAVDDVRRIGLQVLEALCAIHRAGLVHRDVKPGNVQLCGDGRIVLTDFGLASAPDADGDARTAVVEGSPAYMSPEAIVDGRFGPASDLYALGVTLYVAVEGRGPFDAETLTSLISSPRTPGYPPPERAGRLRALIDGLMCPDPRRRTDAAAARGYLREAC